MFAARGRRRTLALQKGKLARERAVAHFVVGEKLHRRSHLRKGKSNVSAMRVGKGMLLILHK